MKWTILSHKTNSVYGKICVSNASCVYYVVRVVSFISQGWKTDVRGRTHSQVVHPAVTIAVDSVQVRVNPSVLRIPGDKTYLSASVYDLNLFLADPD